MPSAYPVPGYRNGGAKERGGATPGAAVPGIQRPAVNFPAPANDNIPPRRDGSLLGDAARVARGLAGLAARANPYVRAFQLGQMLGELVGPVFSPMSVTKAGPLPAPQVQFDPTGWTQICAGGTGVGPGITGRGLMCGTGDQASSKAEWAVNLQNGIRITGGTVWTAVFYEDVREPHPLDNGFVRWDKAAHWQRPVAEMGQQLMPALKPQRRPQEWVRPVPSYIPAIDPFAVPHFRPMPTPRPVPYRVIPHRQPNPWRSPQEQPQRGPLPQPATRPRPRPGTRPGVTPRPAPVPIKPGQVLPEVPPGFEIPPAIVINAKTAPRTSARPHRRRPPDRKKEKELKFKLANPFLVSFILNAATESADMIEAFYWAIDKEERTKWWLEHYPGKKHLTPQQMLSAVWELRNFVDAEKALHNGLINGLVDIIFATIAGGIGRMHGQLFPQLPSPLIGPAL